MTRRRWQISRRTFLRGAGVTLGLPLLDVMRRRAAGGDEPAAGESESASGPPVRMACLFFPNGVWQDAWIPKQTGADYELPYALEPLAPHKSECLVLSGLDKAASRSGDGHYAKTANFLTGTPVIKTTGKDISCGGISIDQLAARKIGHNTPLASLELGIDPVVSGIDSNVGYTRLYASFISWQAPNLPVAKEIHPRLVYQRLFGDSRASASHAVNDRRSLLDLALEDANDLRRNLGRDDRFKLDEYLDAVRAVERQIDFASRPDERRWKPGPPPAERMTPPGETENYPQHVRLMLDMLVLAFWTDSTRIASFMFANDVSGRNFSFIDGVAGAHHELSHHENRAEKIEQYKRINRWHVEQLAYLLDRMGSIKEDDQTLLDHSLVLFGCGMSDGNRHDPNNLPIVLAGRGGGNFTSGRHLASPANTPLCNLYVSLLQRVGAPVDAFGDSTGPLAGLS